MLALFDKNQADVVEAFNSVGQASGQVAALACDSHWWVSVWCLSVAWLTLARTGVFLWLLQSSS